MTRITEPSPAELVRFKWRRMEQGSLQSVADRRVLVGWGSDEMYEPLRSDPALFRHFASLPDTPEAFLAFAEAYGDLQDDFAELVVIEGFNAVGRPLELWRAHRRLLAFAIDVWDAIRADRTESLIGSQLVVQEVDQSVGAGFLVAEGRQVVAEVLAPLGKELREVWLSGIRDEEARVYHESFPVTYRKAIAHLERRNLSPAAVAGAALAQLVTRCCRDLSVAMVVTTSPGAPLRLTFQVESLIAAMWLQLALAIDGGRDYRSCPVCGRWWDATSTRSDKLTCSDRCRKSRQRAKATDEREAE